VLLHHFPGFVQDGVFDQLVTGLVLDHTLNAEAATRLLRDGLLDECGNALPSPWILGCVPDESPDRVAEPTRDLVRRAFHASRPNQRWVSDLTYVATWRGFVYVAFVIDVFARRIAPPLGLLDLASSSGQTSSVAG
jgi:hypothetical protein